MTSGKVIRLPKAFATKMLFTFNTVTPEMQKASLKSSLNS